MNVRPIRVPSEPVGDESSQHVRTQFLRRVAHDIASPTGVTLTVLDELANATNRPELVAMARRSLRRLMRLSEHLALVAELEGGVLEPDLAAADLRAVTKQAFDDAVAVDGRKDITASIHLSEEPALLPGDGRLLAFVVREIVGNALKLACSRVEVSLTKEGSTMTLRVDDDGPGFSPEARAMLGRRFEPRTAARGLGLSLSMAIDILRTHGATLAIGSSALPPGRRGTPGSAVIVTFPATSNDSQAT